MQVLLMGLKSLQNYSISPIVSIQLQIQQGRHCHLFFQQQWYIIW